MAIVRPKPYVTSKKMLVGIPVFRLGNVASYTLNSVIDTPADVLIVDNGADADVKRAITAYPRAKVIVNEKNEYVNFAWNQIMKYGLDNGYDIIALGTGTRLHPGWYDPICHRADEFSKEIWMPACGEPQQNPNYLNVQTSRCYPGFFTWLPREAVEIVYPIHPTLRHWYGDAHIGITLMNLGWNVTILNEVRADHQWGVVRMANPDCGAVIQADKNAWEVLNRETPNRYQFVL